MSHTITLKRIEPVTHDTNQLTFTKPDGFDFTPGQAVDFTLAKDGWRDETRPFTLTSQPEDDDLQFVIKSYPDHDGVTEQVAMMKPQDQVTISDPWGAIEDKGQGIFVAGGTGLTPFIPILRARAKRGEMQNCTLLYGAHAERDLILKDEWDQMEGLDTAYVLSSENKSMYDHGRICLDILNEFVEGTGEGDHWFYCCGPEPMVDMVVDNLNYMGVEKDRIVTEG